MAEILFLSHRAPYPPDRGDRIRSWHVLRHLAARVRVHLVTLDEEGGEPPVEVTAMLASHAVIRRRRSRPVSLAHALARGLPVSLTAFEDGAVAAAIARIRREHSIAATYVFSGQMAQYRGAGRRIVDFVDVDSAKFAQMASRGPLGWLYRREARLLGHFERGEAARADAALFVSDAEVDLFRRAGGAGRVVTVENGIDAQHFDPAIVGPCPTRRPTIVFTGQMDYAPNVGGVRWLAREVLPIVRRSVAADFAIVGRAPTPAVRALAGEGVIVTGEVADTRSWLAAAAVSVAPLHLARGVQNKVLEAMAMARPIVATAAAAEGIDHGGTIRIATDAPTFAAAILALLEDSAAATALGLAARAQVSRRYDWGARLAPLDALLGLDQARQAA